MRKEDFVLTDFLLIQKMKQGNEQAFNTFVRKYYNEILKYCSYHCYDTEYAEDLTQETFVNFFAKLSDYHYQGKTMNYRNLLFERAGKAIDLPRVFMVAIPYNTEKMVDITDVIIGRNWNSPLF